MNSKTQEEQIQELNDTVKCRLAPSKVHGVGVFAIRDIQKGEKLHCAIEEPTWYTVTYANLDKLRPEIRQLILDRWSLVVVGQPFLCPNHDAIMICFMNFGGDESNYDPKTDTALKDLKRGDEVFEDYRNAKGWEVVYPWIHVI
jgi:hypothetical protein